MFVRVVFLYFKHLISDKSCLHGRDDNNNDIIKIHIQLHITGKRWYIVESVYELLQLDSRKTV